MKKERYGYDPPVDPMGEPGAQIELDALNTLKMAAKGPAWLVALLSIVFGITLIGCLLVYWMGR